ncbi:hypothetical protein RJ641_019173 [Dillenia turbinata]|uniref:Magnesium transporter n=1 Tax=Dillenia turbinata TaxID=194707 RepID=A0AAN8UT85_9MAGN
MRASSFRRLHPKPDDEPDPTPQIPNPNLPALIRKKGTGVRPWLLIDSTGQAQVVEAGKHSIMRKTGLPARDLRILDPLLSSPSTILGREKAIVINLEHIKAIITAQAVWLLNSRDPLVTPFVEELQRRLLRLHHATKAKEAGANGNDTSWTNSYVLEEPRSAEASPINLSGGFPQAQEADEEGEAHGKQGIENRDGLKVLPFEFIALEACIEAACSCLESEARTLEQEAHLALDKLTSKISTLNLERVRQIKSRLVAITGRVQKVRDELEHLLDDDEDMAEMFLTDKMVQQFDNSLVSSSNGKDMDDSHGTHTSTTHSVINKQLDVEELEMLLEAYFVQIDGTLNKLSTLREYVEDTEDYINIMLDDKQNNLLQMGVMLTTATLVMTASIVATGMLSININIELFNIGTMRDWLRIVGGSAAAILTLYMIAIAWAKHKRLLE